MAAGYRVAVVGASGTVGGEIIKILEERNFPVDEIIPLASDKSLGISVQFRDRDIPVRVIDKGSFKAIDISFFSADITTSNKYVPIALDNGSVVIDNTPCFRMDKDVPLIVPEINAQRIKEHKGIIANPGSPTIQLVLAVYPIHKAARIKRIVVSTYQAVSETGTSAMDELTEQIRDLFSFSEPRVQVYPHQIAFNVLPHIDEFMDNGYTLEEMKIVTETKKILEDDSIRICATSVRIPVFYSHCESVNIETQKKITTQEVRKILMKSPGLKVEDDPSQNLYPLPIYASGKDECFVGRIREDLSVDNGITMWIVSDNIRKGSALNAVQIAEHLISLNK